MTKKLLCLLLAGFVCLALAGPTMVMAEDVPDPDTQITEDEILPTAFGDETGLGTQELTTTIASIIRVALGFLGVVAVLIVLYGGFMWMTAGGNEDRVTKARQIMTAGLIGLIIILAAYAIASFVISSLVTATTE